jgi:hypothetical protein
MVESRHLWFVNMDTLCSARAARWAIAALQEGRDETDGRLMLFMLHFYRTLPKVKEFNEPANRCCLRDRR